MYLTFSHLLYKHIWPSLIINTCHMSWPLLRWNRHRVDNCWLKYCSYLICRKRQVQGPSLCFSLTIWCILSRQVCFRSARGLFIPGMLAIIQAFLIPKFVYKCALPPIPNELMKQLNQLLFKFWLMERNRQRKAC